MRNYGNDRTLEEIAADVARKKQLADEKAEKKRLAGCLDTATSEYRDDGNELYRLIRELSLMPLVKGSHVRLKAAIDSDLRIRFHPKIGQREYVLSIHAGAELIRHARDTYEVIDGDRSLRVSYQRAEIRFAGQTGYVSKNGSCRPARDGTPFRRTQASRI